MRTWGLTKPRYNASSNSRIELSISTSMLSGPTVAGALIGVIGAPLALIGDAVSFLASALLLRDGVVVTVATIDASSQGIDQILWMMRPSKLTAISTQGKPMTGSAMT